MNRAQRRAAGHHRPRSCGELGRLDGVPVYDGTVVAPVDVEMGRGGDVRVMLGIGPSDGAPVAYLALCPCDGVDGLVADLKAAAAAAAPHHPPHQGVYHGSESRT